MEDARHITAVLNNPNVRCVDVFFPKDERPAVAVVRHWRLGYYGGDGKLHHIGYFVPGYPELDEPQD